MLRAVVSGIGLLGESGKLRECLPLKQKAHSFARGSAQVP